jgi:drug efflux transport system permease protein
MWPSFVAVFRKEFLHVRRDRGTLTLALSIPLFQLLLFGFIDQTVRNLPLVVVDQSMTPASRELIDRVAATGTFRVRAMTADPREARAEIISGRARAGLVIPPEYAQHRARGETAQVLVLIDGSDNVAASQAQAAVDGVAADVNGKTLHADKPLDARSLILFNPTARTSHFIIPGMIAILLQIVALVLASVAIVREREQGTLEQLLVTPIDPLGLILGKLAPYLILGCAEMALILLLMRFGFSVHIRGSLPFLFAMAVIYQFALLAIGLFISTRARTQTQAQQIAQMVFLPSVFLSGYIFPVEGLPWVLKAAGRLLPATHMIAILRGVVLRGAGPTALMPNVLALLGLAVVLVWMSARTFRKLAT